jgi:hypothetical protein
MVWFSSIYFPFNSLANGQSVFYMMYKLADTIHDSRYYINVIIFIIRVLKLILMKYRSVLLILIAIAFLLAPASADLRKIAPKSPVFIGEMGVDISSALNGCNQIGWWRAGNTTDDVPDKVIDIKGDMFNYTISSDLFSGYTGTWYCYNKQPNFPIFDVVKPEFDLKVWDLDHDRDVTGQIVPQSTRITYRIDTNLYPVFNVLNRPGLTLADSFMKVTLTDPNGQAITNIYTASIGSPDNVILNFDSNPVVKSSTYYWTNGGSWNRSAKDNVGAVIYPLGTYTFVGTQNLNNMLSYYGNDSRVNTGPRTITFVADVVATTPPVTSPAVTISASPIPTELTTPATMATSTTAPELTATETVTQKPTWTSAPLPIELTILGLGLAGLFAAIRYKKN